MTHGVLKLSLISFVLFTYADFAYAWGTWTKTTSWHISHRISSPSFLILKTGIFHRSGLLKATLTPTQLGQACSQGKEIHAWITHRLSPGERLTLKAGKKLGNMLAKLLSPSCIRSIELDIEPLPSPPDWLVPFLDEITSELDSKYTLRMATPPLSTSPIPGITWTPEQALKVLPSLHGFDFMIYDTGTKTIASYERLIRRIIDFTQKALRRFPGKSFYLGFPAYEDKTKRHSTNIENPMKVRQLLAKLSKKESEVLCSPKIQFSYYASWTIDKKDAREIDMIEQWRKTLCRKN